MNFTDIRKKIIRNSWSNLNDKQFEAVVNTEGPLLVIAGAGSGKTTVIIHKIAHLMIYGKAYFDTEIPKELTEEELEILDWYSKGDIDELPPDFMKYLSKNPASPYNILAITFTNKAAAELKSRLSAKLGKTGEDVWASTFHSSCVRFLRRDIDRLGFEKNFVIFDTSDSQTLIKECMKDLNIDSKEFTPKAIGGAISQAKNELIYPDEYASIFKTDFYKSIVARIYKMYQERLKKYNALDFDDLIMCTVKLFEENPDVLEYYQQKFRYILVDEYQDTNHAQYRLVSLLAGGYRNICVVGDDDQSIYKFRGADISNILGFEDEFENAKTIKLEENYRSTQNILNAANGVIANNRGRKPKKLWTQNGSGETVTVYNASNEHDEAKYIADKLGVELQIVPLEFTAVLSSVAEGKYDLAISALAYKPDRAEAMNLSKGYYFDEDTEGYGMLCRAEDVDKYPDAASMKNAVIVVQAGSLQQDYVMSQIPEYKEINEDIEEDE